MYSVNDKASAIKEIQKYLSYYSETFIATSGIYDSNTRLAVKRFQENEGLQITGTVDYATFNRLYSVYSQKEEKENIRNRNSRLISFPLMFGQSYDEMLYINQILSELLTHYNHPPIIRIGRFFSEETLRAVQILERTYLLEPRGIIDEVFYSRIINDIGSINTKKAFSEKFE